MKKIFTTLAVVMLVFTGCNEISDISSIDADQTQIVLNVNNLPILNETARYVSWLYLDDRYNPIPNTTAPMPANLGVLNPSANGNITDLVIPVKLYDLRRAKYFVVTIESADEPVNDSVPSSTHILAGTIIGNDIPAINMTHNFAFEFYLDSTSGKFTLYTPTDPTNQNTTSGIWFVNYENNRASAGLGLSTLPTGWKYQGWIQKGDLILSTGQFTVPGAADESAEFSGTGAAPAFPGEDFLNNPPQGTSFPLDLSGAVVFITIEPETENNPLPFGLRILSAEIPAGAVPFTSYDLQPISGSAIPRGNAAATISLQ